MRARLLVAFAAVYLIWGSTYLAIRFAVETLPPLLMGSARFLMAGGLLCLWSLLRNGESPTRRDALTGFVSGALMLFGGNGAVIWAEQRVPSGIAALLVAVVPLWMVLLDWLRPGGRRPVTMVFAGLALGLVGLGLLVSPDTLHGGSRVSMSGVWLLMAGSFAWAAGSLYTQRAPRPTSGTLGSGLQMLSGGVCLLVAGLVAREPSHVDLAHASLRSLLALLYLITFGSIIGFTAYLYLLAHTTAAKAATYAYVNPVVAVALGWALAHEPVTPRTILAAAVILSGVAIITVARDTRVSAPSLVREAA
jgi:drug/metabolite transporter (DMT)-like permease